MEVFFRNAMACFIVLFTFFFVDVHGQVEARRASDYMESTGISGLKIERYSSSQMPYVKQRVKDLKIRYARNRIHSDSAFIDLQYRFYTDFGIKWILNYATAVTPPTKGFDLLKNNYPTPDMLLAIEGLNEPFNFSTGSASEFFNHQTQVYNLVKEDSQLKDLPVVGISVAHSHRYEKLGDMRNISDLGNLHSYPTTDLHPEAGKLEEWISAADDASHEGQAYWVTEAGYHDNKDIGGTPSMVQAKYLPRLILYYFLNDRIDKFFYYRLLDEGTGATTKWWGICHNDETASPKPAYTAWKNMNSILNDSNATFTPGTLDYKLEGELSDVFQVLLQKGDGRYYLILWQGVDNWDADGVEFKHDDRELTLKFGSAVSEVKTYLPTFNSGEWPYEGYGTTPKNGYSDVSEISIDVPDHILIIEIEK